MNSVKTREKIDAPRRNEALFKLRTTWERTQEEFARDVGMDESTYQKTERGLRALEAREAELIMALTGADASALISGRKATAIDGRTYSVQIRDEWKQRPLDPKILDLMARQIGWRAEQLVRASFSESLETDSMRGAKPQRYRQFVGQISCLLTRLADERGLRSQWRKRLATTPFKERITDKTVGQLRKILGITDASVPVIGWDHVDANKQPAERKFKVRIRRFALDQNTVPPVKWKGRGRMVVDGSIMEIITVEGFFPWTERGSKSVVAALDMKVFLTDFNETQVAVVKKPIGPESPFVKAAGLAEKARTTKSSKRMPRPKPAAPKAV